MNSELGFQKVMKTFVAFVQRNWCRKYCVKFNGLHNATVQAK